MFYGDGEYTKDERLVKATKEGFKIQRDYNATTASYNNIIGANCSLSESRSAFEFANRWDPILSYSL